MLLDRFITNDRIIDRDTGQVEVLGVISRDETVSNVRYVETSIRLSSDVGLPVVNSEQVNKALVEAAELYAKLNLVGNVRDSLGVAYTDRLFNPKHIGQVVPAVGVLYRGKRACLPSEWAVLRDETTERTAAGSAVEPILEISVMLIEMCDLERPYQITISSGVSESVDGKNQKKSFRVSDGSSEIGNKPAYDSPISKGTSGIPVPLTEKAGRYKPMMRQESNMYTDAQFCW